MRKNNDDEPKYIAPKQIYSEAELQEFNKELSKYLESHTLKDGSTTRVYDFRQYHKDHGSMGEYGGVILEKDGFGDYMRPSKYEVIEEKINQWSIWKFRQEAYVRRRLEGMQQLADQMNINKDNQ